MRLLTSLLFIAGILLLNGCEDVVIKDVNSLESREQKAAALRSQLDALNMEVYWYYPLPEEKITAMDLRGELLFVQTSGNLLYALEPENGVVRWVFQLDTPIDFAPAISESHVAFTASSVMYLLDTRGGNLIWKKVLPFSASSSTTLDRQHVYVGSYDHFFYAFKLSNGARDWRYRTEGSITGAPITEDPAVYFTSEDHNIYALNASNGDLSWKFGMNGPLTGDPYIRGTKLYVPSADFNLYCINRITGNIRWKYEAGESVLSAPIVSGESSYSASSNHLLGINDRTGRELFRLEGHYDVLAKGEQDLFVKSTKNISGKAIRELVVIDAEKGVLKSHSSVSKFRYFITNHENSIVFLASSDGVIFALKEK